MLEKLTDEKKNPQEAQSGLENNNIGFNEAVHQWL